MFSKSNQESTMCLKFSQVCTCSYCIFWRRQRPFLFFVFCGFALLNGLPTLVSFPRPGTARPNSVNGKRVLGREFADLVRSLQRVGRPVNFGLVPSVDVRVTVDGPPLELELRRVSGRVTVTGFCEVRLLTTGVRSWGGACLLHDNLLDAQIAQHGRRS